MPAAPPHPVHKTKRKSPDRIPPATTAETASEIAYRGTRTLLADPEHFAKRRESQVDEQSGKLPGG
jgi:hypothetical protein